MASDARGARGGSELNFTLVERGNSVGAFPLASLSADREALRYGKTKQKNFLYIFYFFRVQFFPLKGKENFSVLCFS